jgi:hypothetical protein
MESDRAPLCRIGTSGQQGKLLASPIADLIRIKCGSKIISDVRCLSFLIVFDISFARFEQGVRTVRDEI